MSAAMAYATLGVATASLLTSVTLYVSTRRSLRRYRAMIRALAGLRAGR